LYLFFEIIRFDVCGLLIPKILEQDVCGLLIPKILEDVFGLYIADFGLGVLVKGLLADVWGLE